MRHGGKGDVVFCQQLFKGPVSFNQLGGLVMKDLERIRNDMQLPVIGLVKLVGKIQGNKMVKIFTQLRVFFGNRPVKFKHDSPALGNHHIGLADRLPQNAQFTYAFSCLSVMDHLGLPLNSNNDLSAPFQNPVDHLVKPALDNQFFPCLDLLFLKMGNAVKT